MQLLGELRRCYVVFSFYYETRCYSPPQFPPFLPWTRAFLMCRRYLGIARKRLLCLIPSLDTALGVIVVQSAWHGPHYLLDLSCHSPFSFFNDPPYCFCDIYGTSSSQSDKGPRLMPSLFTLPFSGLLLILASLFTLPWAGLARVPLGCLWGIKVSYAITIPPRLPRSGDQGTLQARLVGLTFKDRSEPAASGPSSCLSRTTGASAARGSVYSVSTIHIDTQGVKRVYWKEVPWVLSLSSERQT